MNRQFIEKDMDMANKPMKKYFTSLAIGEMNVKTIMRCHYTHIRMAKI